MSYEREFGYKIKSLLDASSESISTPIQAQLRVAREHALDAARPRLQTQFELALAPGGHPTLHASAGKLSWGGRISLVISIALLALGIYFVNQQWKEQAAQDLVELDTALLSDDLPADAYLDKNFQAFLRSKR